MYFLNQSAILINLQHEPSLLFILKENIIISQSTAQSLIFFFFVQSLSWVDSVNQNKESLIYCKIQETKKIEQYIKRLKDEIVRIEFCKRNCRITLPAGCKPIPLGQINKSMHNKKK